MLIEEEKPRRRKKSDNDEGRLQAAIVKRFHAEHPEMAGRLFGYFANSDSKTQGAVKLSLGLVKNFPDLSFISKTGGMICAELKTKGSRHNRLHLIGQAEWLIKNPLIGAFIDDEDEFFEFIFGRSDGILPEVVLENCLRLKTESVDWDKVKIKKI